MKNNVINFILIIFIDNISFSSTINQLNYLFWEEPADVIRYLVNYGTDDFVKDIYLLEVLMLISKYYVIGFGSC